MARELKGDFRALLTRDAAEAADAELVEWLSMWGMIDPSHAETDLHGRPQRPGGEPEPQGVSGQAGDHHRRPDPEILLINAYRIFRARRALIDQGTVTVNDIAAAHRCHPSTARRRIQRACDRNELFTVHISGQIHVPVVLLDDACHARSEWKPVITALTESRMTDWAKWGWIARPNAGLSGEIAAEVIETNPQRVHSAARRKVIQETS